MTNESMCSPTFAAGLAVSVKGLSENRDCVELGDSGTCKIVKVFEIFFHDVIFTCTETISASIQTTSEAGLTVLLMQICPAGVVPEDGFMR